MTIFFARGFDNPVGEFYKGDPDSLL